MDGQLVDGHIVRRVFGVGPANDSVVGGMQDILRVGAGKVGGEGHVERVVYRSVEGLGTTKRSGYLRRHLLVGIYGVHAQVRGPRHAEIRAHPFGPMTHVGQLVHCGCEALSVESSHAETGLKVANGGAADERERQIDVVT